VISKSTRTSNSNNSAYAYDDDLSTYWYVAGNRTPSSGYVYFDLGAQRKIGSIQWIFAANSYPGFADGLVIEVSSDKVHWTEVATPGGAPADQWQQLPAGVSAQYVRFYFGNPANAARLGFLAEVRFLP
jgi:hypothetical protein